MINNHSQLHAPEGAEATYARRIAARLNTASQDLPYDITERLRAARAQAVAQRRRPVALVVPALQASGGAVLTLGGSDQPGWWTRLASALPVVALVAGLVAINMIQAEQRAAEVAEVDAAILTDDLPPAAYTDPGFLQYLKAEQSSAQ